MSRKIWLINLFGTPCAPSSFCPDNSLASLAASLKEAGYSPLILDYQTVDFCSKLIPEKAGKNLADIVAALREGKEEQDLQIKMKHLHQQLETHQDKLLDAIVQEFEDRLKSERPLFVGFKLYSGEGHHLVTELINKLKHRNWPTKIIGGGPLLRVIGKDYLHCYGGIDFLLDGEAERSIIRLAQHLEGKRSLQEVPGLIYQEGEKVFVNPTDYIENLDSLPPPLYDKEVYPALYGKNQKAFIFQIDDSRGCPNNCSFCVHPSMNGNLVRCRSARSIVSQMADLQEKFGAFCFRFTGSNTPKKLLREITNEIHRTNLDVRFSCYASINMTSIDEIRNFKTAGLAGLFIGVETLDENVLKNIFRKNQNTEAARQLVKDSLAEGIYTTTSWIYPAPHQTQV